MVCVIGMQSGQTEVASLGKCERMLHGFLMSNLSNEDDIWRLPQGIGKGVIEGQGVGPYLALVHDASFGPVSERHRVHNGDDMTVGVFSSVIDQRCQRVDLPDPVPPTNKISPRFCMTRSISTGGRPKSL